MARTSFWRTFLAIALTIAGCGGARGYLYTPGTTTLTSAEPAQSRTAEYPFPPGSPHGDIRLATSGIAKLADDAPHTVQLRMVVRNRSEERWIIDTREQKVVLAAREGERQVATATPLPSGPTLIEVTPQQSATIDLSFALPPAASKPSEIPAFDAVWTVHVGDRAVTTTTTFERLVVPSGARDVPAAGAPFDRSPPLGGERLPGTPDSRWNETVPLPERGLR